MIQYYYTKKEWGVVMEKEELKILEELRRILNSKNEAIVILNNYFKGGVGKSKLSTMFAYLTDKFNLKVLMIDKDLQATLTKDLIFSFSIMDNHLSFSRYHYCIPNNPLLQATHINIGTALSPLCLYYLKIFFRGLRIKIP